MLCVLWEWPASVSVSVEIELILLGIATLATAALLTRRLRDRTTGIVSTPARESELAEAAQMASMLPMAAPGGRMPEADDALGERGGRFGGGGASTRY